MLKSCSRLGLVALGAGLAMACGSRTVPLAAVEGTTAMVTIPRTFDVGYGLVVAKNPDSLESPPPFPAQDHEDEEDIQRGELIFTLLDPTAPPGENERRLPISMITRVALDPASDAARNPGWAYADFKGAQAIALFDIPVGIVNDGEQKDFKIRVDRYRRSAANLDVYERVPQTYAGEWYGWGEDQQSMSEAFIPITILDAPEPEGEEVQRVTPLLGYGANEMFTLPFLYEQDLTDYIRLTQPRPEVRIEAPDPLDAQAWEMEVTIPLGKVAFSGVRLLRKESDGAIVLYRLEPGGVACAADGSPRKVFVKVVDPEPSRERRAHGVAILFQNRNSCPQPQRVVPGDVVLDPASIKAYDLAGAITTAPAFAVVARDLM